MAGSTFNKEQQLALNNPIDRDLIISAGAGSGKTRTLSEKVMKLINEGLKPSELLVLTFTNNAAKEMKDRIIDKFKDNKDIAFQLANAHIQTFDSFSQYLVGLYSDRLKISKNISIANEDVLATKKREFLDEVFDSFYLNNEKKNRLLRTLLKFNIQDDSASRKVVLDLINQIEKLPLDEQDKFLNHYEENFFSKEHIESIFEQIINVGKSIISDEVYYANFLEEHRDEIKECKVSELEQIFSNKTNFDDSINYLLFEDQEGTQPLYHAILELLDLKGKEFLTTYNNFTVDHAELFGLKGPKGSDREAYKTLTKLFTNKTGSLDFLKNILDFDEEYNKVLSFKNDIALYLEIAKEIINKLNDYKKITNSYTFSDISNMALLLVSDPRYEDVAEEIRSRFKFIMVDEYQDTNDLQEIFINSLLKENKKGERNHLFCVGDAKQSIYAFRGSNVELFRKRQYLYQKSKDCAAISMNKNYRSGEQLLKDINYIFNYYMTINHGSIAYHQTSESLQYDKDIDLYNKEYKDFGIHRITSLSSINYDNPPCGAKEWEARAIAHDIKKKMKEKFLVSERTRNGNILRECKYSDFCILVRKASGAVDIYQKVFEEYEIPFNCKIKNDLKEVSAVTVIQSLINLMSYVIQDKVTDYDCVHAFASVARSYLYEYNDKQIYDLVYDKTKQFFLMNNDPIMIQVIEFVNKHKDSPFSQTFLDLINEFGVIEKLYKLGNVDDSIMKIESLYSMALSQEKGGEGIEEFVSLLNNVKKYDMDLNDESLYQVEDAVDFMTIHASKGLERKIVYLPNKFNSIAKGDNRDKPDYSFSRENGISLRNYSYEYKEDEEQLFSIFNIFDQLEKEIKKEEKIAIDENVRLFYVALTRAENIIYIVGDLEKLTNECIEKHRKSDTLYGMMSYAPYYPVFGEEIINKFKDEIKDLYPSYEYFANRMKHIKCLNSDDFDDITYQRYTYLWREYYQNNIFKNLLDVVNQIEERLFKHYFIKFESNTDDDLLARIFGEYFFNDSSIENVDDLLKHHNNQMDDEEENTSNLEIDEENIHDFLKIFKDCIVNGTNLPFLRIKPTKELTNNMFGKGQAVKQPSQPVPYKLKDYFLELFVYHFGGIRRYKYLSFKTDGFNDDIITFDYKANPGKKSSQMVPNFTTLKLDDSIIEFPLRIKQKASKTLTKDEELPAKEVLDYGTYLHRLLEIVDYKTKDTSFIKNEDDRAIIDKVLAFGIFDNLDKADVYQEYGYYDEELSTVGFIDLLIRKDDQYYIIDYKASNIFDPEYEKQLQTYQRNVKRIFNAEDSHIYLYLISIKQGKIRKVN